MEEDPATAVSEPGGSESCLAADYIIECLLLKTFSTTGKLKSLVPLVKLYSSKERQFYTAAICFTIQNLYTDIYIQICIYQN